MQHKHYRKMMEDSLQEISELDKAMSLKQELPAPEIPVNKTEDEKPKK